jgi:hypothetical protein
VRFRGGVALEGGPFIAPGAVTLGQVGVQGQLGVHINRNFGAFAVPRFDIVFGAAGGVAIGFAALGGYHFDDLPIAVGAGPEVGAIAAFGASVSSTGASAAAIGGGFFGALLHFAWYPVFKEESNGKRSGLSVGFDLHLLSGTYAGGSASVNTTNDTSSEQSSIGHFALSPMVMVGYSSF